MDLILGKLFNRNFHLTNTDIWHSSSTFIFEDCWVPEDREYHVPYLTPTWPQSVILRTALGLRFAYQSSTITALVLNILAVWENEGNPKEGPEKQKQYNYTDNCAITAVMIRSRRDR
mmetsp:Transcript_15094/g.24551  ORF Transcript_15094/g.24551 Transcript_15094/m.24551 type:complete len:117 (-) Transcript_15094:517-867(-)